MTFSKRNVASFFAQALFLDLIGTNKAFCGAATPLLKQQEQEETLQGGDYHDKNSGLRGRSRGLQGISKEGEQGVTTEIFLPLYDNTLQGNNNTDGEISNNLFEGDIVPDYDFIMENYGSDVVEELEAEGLIEEPLHNDTFSVKSLHTSRRWPKRGVNNLVEVPYQISSSYNGFARAKIVGAVKDLEDRSKVVKFVQRTSQSDYIQVEPNSSCSSYVGRTGGKQVLSLGDGCISIGIIQHEFLHAIGMFHEQSRPDRDNYVIINHANIENGKEYNFNKVSWSKTLGNPYDYGSVMHYSKTAFSKNGRDTITSKNGASLGQRNRASNQDIIDMRLLYQCTSGTRTLLQYNANRCTSDCKCWQGESGCNRNNDACQGSLICNHSNNKCSNVYVDYFGYNAGGWRTDRHPRHLVDVNGDGKADIVGFGYAGAYVSLSTGSGSTSGFTNPSLWINSFSYNGGWRTNKYPRHLVDVNGDGKADIVGFGYAGVYVSLSTGSGFTNPSVWTNGFGYNNGWRTNKYPRHLVDVNGDGKADIVGFGYAGVYVSLSTGNGFTNIPLWTNSFSYNGGWRTNKYPRHLVDVNGDGMADIVGFGYAGVYVSLSTGSGFTNPSVWTNGFGYNNGWRIDRHPRHLVDVNGDGKADIVGFGYAGVYVSLSTGSGFTDLPLWTNSFGYNAGWRIDRHPRHLADTSGDGKADIVGFGYAGVYVAPLP